MNDSSSHDDQRADTDLLIAIAQTPIPLQRREQIEVILTERGMSVDDINCLRQLAGLPALSNFPFGDRPASRFRRIGAFLIDIIVLNLSMMLVHFLLHQSGLAWAKSLSGIFVSLCLGYMLIRDALPNGGIGKRCLRLRAVTASHGEALTVWRSCQRNLAMLMTVFELIAFLFNENKQRMGDQLAKSIVVDLYPE
ncbi:RDD family protein [Undibacterium curvum]|uniref:RDD family protein n=1 Tax=Undibacterium curvum TaxID=2762294 RepID=A0ABR7A9J8_9BURK|nr:RDD family protein [Undibacterium curvum]MBC3933342.1 RDD family protein [Undibacterium curvum]